MDSQARQHTDRSRANSGGTTRTMTSRPGDDAPRGTPHAPTATSVLCNDEECLCRWRLSNKASCCTRLGTSKPVQLHSIHLSSRNGHINAAQTGYECFETLFYPVSYSVNFDDLLFDHATLRRAHLTCHRCPSRILLHLTGYNVPSPPVCRRRPRAAGASPRFDSADSSSVRTEELTSDLASSCALDHPSKLLRRPCSSSASFYWPRPPSPP